MAFKIAAVTYGEEEAGSEDARSAKGVFHISSTVGALPTGHKIIQIHIMIRMMTLISDCGNVDDKHNFENDDAGFCLTLQSSYIQHYGTPCTFYTTHTTRPCQ